jgi:hypothetical protein
MKGTIIEVECYAGEQWLEQGVKDGRTPKHAKSGSNGSFNCATPSQLYLNIELTDGRCIYENVTSRIKEITGWQRITSNRAAELHTALVGAVVEVEERDYDNKIIGLKEIVEDL